MIELRPHQEEAVRKMHNGCILCGGVGVGKSHTAVQYYLENEAPKPVYVITTAKKRDKGDWQELWALVGMHWNPELTMGAVVIVDSWENIKKYTEVKNGFFIFDEQRLVGTGAWSKAFYRIAAANRWIMLSATPGDNWLDYVPVFRANGFIKNITQFKEDHVLQRWTGRYYQITGYRQVPQLVRWRNQLLVPMPYEKHTTRHAHDIEVTYDKDIVKELVDKRWHVYEQRPLTDASELFRVMRKVVYSDESRLQAVRGLLQKHPKLIVFYNFDYELEILRGLKNPSSESLTTSGKSLTKQTPNKKHRLLQETVGNLLPNESLEMLSSDGSVLIENPMLLESQSGRSHVSSKTKTESPSQPSSRQGGRSNGSRKVSSNSSGTEDYYLTGTWTEDQGIGELYLPRVSLESGTTTVSLRESLRSPEKLPGVGDAERLESQITASIASDESTLFEETLMENSTSNEKMSNGTSMPGFPCTPETTSNCNEPRDTTKPSMTGSPESTQRSTGTELRDSTLTETYGLREPSRSSLSIRTERPDHPPRKTRAQCQKEIDAWKAQFLTQNQDTSTVSEQARDTSTVSDGSTIPEGSLSTSTTNRSSKRLNQSPDSSTIGSDSMSSEQFQVAEWNGHKHEDLPTTTSWVYLVQYVAGAEAWECTDTDAIVFYSMPYSYKLWWQAHGRIDRLNTPFTDLHYYTLFGNSVLEKAVKLSLRAKKSFNESAFSKNFGF